MRRVVLLLFAMVCASGWSWGQPLTGNLFRKEIPLDQEQVWRMVRHDSDPEAYAGFEQPNYDDGRWETVTIPHRAEGYQAYGPLSHAHRHGYVWYRTSFTLSEEISKENRIFLYFEGVGAYATVYVNGNRIGEHAGGQTTFTLDATDAVRYGASNTLAVRADHPEGITELPWGCGGCSAGGGVDGSSQPLGIFRPVHLIVTGDMRIEPFGVHIWNDSPVAKEEAILHLRAEVKNYRNEPREIEVRNTVYQRNKYIVSTTSRHTLAPGEVKQVEQTISPISEPLLWSPEHPNLYVVITDICEKGSVVDRMTTPYGIRWIDWEGVPESVAGVFRLNGEPLLLNGTTEEEHQMGYNHAFPFEQIQTRVEQIRAAGFNSFRDGSQPLNLRYNALSDLYGLLRWPQMSASLWHDTPAFRANFKRLLRDYIKERRNSPSVILWGLQDDSQLPPDFTEECMVLFRELDPTAFSQRRVTTGSEEKAPVGEYAIHRSIDAHSEGAVFAEDDWSEDRMTQLLEEHIREADSLRDRIAGHFQQAFSSPERPARTLQPEGFRMIDRVGPVDPSGLFTPWGEPSDAYYMYRANFAPKETEPMVYIAMHTWPDRWTVPRKKENIKVYSNCDSVELFNDILRRGSLGRQVRQGGVGSHFVWDQVPINYNLLLAVGYVADEIVATDIVILNHLEEPAYFFESTYRQEELLKPQGYLNYLYRVNCGGDSYVDGYGSEWMADRRKTSDTTWGSYSWADQLPGVSPYLGSQRRIRDPIWNGDWPLFQTFRYGTDQLRYEFPLPDGEYILELYFVEPWYGRDFSCNAQGWRLFDVAVNGQPVLRDLDLWSMRGGNLGQRYTVRTQVSGGKLTLSFPNVKSGQAVISALAIASEDLSIQPAKASPGLVKVDSRRWEWHHWLDTGDEQYRDAPVAFAVLPSEFYGAEWLKSYPDSRGSFLCEFTDDAQVYLLIDNSLYDYSGPEGFERTPLRVMNGWNQFFTVYTKRFAAGEIFDCKSGAANRIENVVVTYAR